MELMYAVLALTTTSWSAAASSSSPGDHRVTIAPGVHMPLISNGAVTLHTDSSSSDVETLALLRWFDHGGRGIDTAWDYGNQRSVGWALRNTSASVRSSLFVTTKIPCVASTEAALTFIEADLAALGVPSVDLVLIHEPGYGDPPEGQPTGCWGFPKPGQRVPPSNPPARCCANASDLQATYAGLELALARNLTRAIGVSNFRVMHLTDLLTTATVKPAVNQCQLYVGAHDDAGIEKCRELGITYQAYSPLGPWNGSKPVLSDPTVLSIAKAHNVTAAQVGMRWIVQGGGGGGTPHAVVTASSSDAYDVEDIDGVFSFTLSVGEMAKLDAVKVKAAGVGATTRRAASAKRTQQQLPRARGDSADAATRIYFGSGCFWGRQHDQVTKFEESKLHRADANITAIGGYAGGHTATGPDGLCCYHNGKNASDYAELGHAEVVQLEIEIDAADATATSARRRRRAVASAARAAMDVYFASFIELSPGIYAREDIYDQNAGYRALVGLPGGVKSALMVQLRAANLHNMSLVEGVGGDADTFGLNAVWIMDSNVFSFQQAELCLQFHNNQTGHYSPAYGELRGVLERDGRLVDNGCPTNYVC